MKTSITWRSPGSEKPHEIPEAAIVTFVRDDGNELQIQFNEDGSVTSKAKGDAEFEHSYFLPPPEPPDWEQIPERVKDCVLYKHSLAPDNQPVDQYFDIRKFNEGDESEVATVISQFNSEWVHEDFQQVFSPVFVIERETGKVYLPTDDRVGTEDQPEVMAWKCKNQVLFKEKVRPLAVPGTDQYKDLVIKAMQAMKKMGWKYFYQFEERANNNGVVVYGIGC